MAAKTPREEAEATGALLHLDPAVILADENTRFNLKESRIQSLAESILTQGGVMEPVEVEKITPDMEVAVPNGQKYRLTVGAYRHAAVTLLNKTQAAGLLLPAIIRPAGTPAERLRRQLAENMERENQSPMDQAIAIRKLLQVGLDKMAVRTIFAVPGGRKGN